MMAPKNAADTGGVRYSLVILLVFVAGVVRASTARPRFLSGIKNVTVAQGREATLECHIENLGKNKVAWIKMDTETLLTYHRHIIVGEPRLRVSDNNERHWQLHIRNAQPSDKGFYMCQINTEPMITEVGFLDVLVPPSILDEETSSDETVDEGSRVSLHCRASGYPPATILWRREDGREINLERYSGRKNSVMTVEGEYLNISQVNREDMGAYLCIAKNGVPPSVSQRILLQVNFRPKIRVSEQLVGAAVGTSVFLECVVEASPRPLTAWIRGDDQILLRSKKYTTSEEVDSYRIRMRLQIHDLRQSDYGRYKCHAKNTFGEKEGFIRLHDIPHPTTLARPTPATEAVVPRTKVSGRDDLQRLRAQADLSITATKSFLDENAQDSPQPGVGLPSNEQSRSGHRPLDRVHFEPPERNRGGTSSGSSINVPGFRCCSGQQLFWSTALLYAYRWSL
ncbi:neurotrimin-like [Amblyomma americanum]